jgi:hypothetical protein
VSIPAVNHHDIIPAKRIMVLRWTAGASAMRRACS